MMYFNVTYYKINFFHLIIDYIVAKLGLSENNQALGDKCLTRGNIIPMLYLKKFN